MTKVLYSPSARRVIFEKGQTTYQVNLTPEFKAGSAVQSQEMTAPELASHGDNLCIPDWQVRFINVWTDLQGGAA